MGGSPIATANWIVLSSNNQDFAAVGFATARFRFVLSTVSWGAPFRRVGCKLFLDRGSSHLSSFGLLQLNRVIRPDSGQDVGDSNSPHAGCVIEGERNGPIPLPTGQRQKSSEVSQAPAGRSDDLDSQQTPCQTCFVQVNGNLQRQCAARRRGGWASQGDLLHGFRMKAYQMHLRPRPIWGWRQRRQGDRVRLAEYSPVRTL